MNFTVPGSSVKRLQFGRFLNNRSLKDINGLLKAAETCLRVISAFLIVLFSLRCGVVRKLELFII